MTELLLDACYSCVNASLVLIKNLAPDNSDRASKLIEAAVEISQTCIACVRSHEAGSVLPETIDRAADACRRFLELVKVTPTETPDSVACSVACDNFIRTYHHVA